MTDTANALPTSLAQADLRRLGYDVLEKRAGGATTGFVVTRGGHEVDGVLITDRELAWDRAGVIQSGEAAA